MPERNPEYEDDDDYGYDPRPRRARRGFRCPYCKSEETPLVRTRISTGGWVVFGVMMFTCFPLFWIGLLMKEDYRECYDCGVPLGR